MRQATTIRHRLKAGWWSLRGRVPGAAGSSAAKWLAIESGIRAATDGRYGWTDGSLDERVVEYAWVFDRLRSMASTAGPVLDAGSVLNHERLLRAWHTLIGAPLSIVTLAYEGKALVSDLARYEFADLRKLPYRDSWFAQVLCISTIEHVGMDTSVYGKAQGRSVDPNAEARLALQELARVTRGGGTLLMSVPFGRRSDRGWLRVLDRDDLDRVITDSGWSHVSSRFFRALESGWRECADGDVGLAGYNEQSRGGGNSSSTAPDYVAAAECVALVEMIRT